MKSLTTLSAFIEVAGTGSFARAAQQLGLSTSATSKAVARLEDELGVKLLHRTTRSVSLTPEGERFLEGSRHLLGEFAILKDEVASSLDEPKGLLRVSVPVALGRLRVVSIASGFQQRFPNVLIDLSLNDRAVDLAGNRIDISIRAGKLEDSATLVARHLFDDRLVTVATPDYWSRAGRPTHPDDLIGHRCINFRNQRTGRLMPWTFTIDGNVQRREVKEYLTLDDGQSVGEAALASCGISQMPTFMAERSLKAG
ncbi:MAG: LysR family transcriptional regulator, partial [Pseudomonadota bacterium]